jgi:hypothetical protein
LRSLTRRLNAQKVIAQLVVPRCSTLYSHRSTLNAIRKALLLRKSPYGLKQSPNCFKKRRMSGYNRRDSNLRMHPRIYTRNTRGALPLLSVHVDDNSSPATLAPLWTSSRPNLTSALNAPTAGPYPTDEDFVQARHEEYPCPRPFHHVCCHHHSAGLGTSVEQETSASPSMPWQAREPSLDMRMPTGVAVSTPDAPQQDICSRPLAGQ